MGVDSLADLRDVTIIAFTIAGTLLFLFAIFLGLVIGLLSLKLLHRAGVVVDDVRGIADGLRKTVSIVSENAVSPLARAYSVYSGGRRVASTFAKVFMGRKGS